MSDTSRRVAALLAFMAAWPAVSCSLDSLGPSSSGAVIQVTTKTTGAVPDPDGYTLLVDGHDAAQVGPTATTTLRAIGAGRHTVQLSGVASHCRVIGENLRQVTVGAGDTAAVSFAISCGTPSGGIRVRVVVITGASQPPGDYTVVLDSSAPRPVGSDGSISFTAVVDGTHTIALDGIAPFCGVQGANPVAVTVAGQVADVTMDVLCLSVLPGKLLFYGYPSGETPSLYALTSPGGQINALTPGAEATTARWSPDGLKIAFESTRDGTGGIFVMNADGSSPVLIASPGSDPSWSPDGSRILYRGPEGLVIVGADGSNPAPVPLANPGIQAVWSPDGSRIALVLRGGPCLTTFDGPLCPTTLNTVRPDGTDLTPVDSVSSFIVSDPAWSPDGTTIAFSGRARIGVSFFGYLLSKGDIYVSRPSASAVNLTRTTDVAESSPVWSPDGRIIVASRYAPSGFSTSTSDLEFVPVAGGGFVTISRPGYEVPTSWR